MVPAALTLLYIRCQVWLHLTCSNLVFLRNMVLLTLTRGRENSEAPVEMEVEEVEEEVDHNKASTFKQMQDIVLTVQVGFFGVHIPPEMINQYLGKSGLDSEPAGECPECVQLQCNSFSNPRWICHHCPGHSCSILSSSQVSFHWISWRNYDFSADSKEYQCFTYTL